MREYEQQQNEYEVREEEIKKEKEFKYLSENLHHLVSTKHIRGVYNPHAQLMDKPTVNEVPVEDYIRGAVKDLIRTRGVTKKDAYLTRDLNGTLKVPVKGKKHRLSLQASVPYDVLEKERKRQKAIHDLLVKDKGSFHVGGKVRLLEDKVAPLCTDDPYMDQWSNPLLKRGVPRDQAHMREVALSRTTAPTFTPAPERPFYVTASGNKSSVHPNDVFDTIADAEESGGVVRRHLATTSRYGIPENCDDRVTGGDLPAPPMKAATLLPSNRYGTSNQIYDVVNVVTGRSVRAHKMMTQKLNATAPVTRSAPGTASGSRGGAYDSSDEED